MRILLAVWMATWTLTAQAKTPLDPRAVFISTLKSLDCMRAPSGLVSDKAVYHSWFLGSCKVLLHQRSTSPTNIGFDILTQMAALRLNLTLGDEEQKLSKMLGTLENIEKHNETGLFYSWYSGDRAPEAKSKNISSVDNIHLAVALWALSEGGPHTLRHRAGELFQKMDMSPFFDETNGLFHGELVPENGTYKAQPWHYGHFGSEARSLSALAGALNLLKSSFNTETFKSFHFEIKDWKGKPLLSTWDGGTFQLLLPEALFQESLYSPKLSKLFSNHVDFATSEGLSENWPTPLGLSASQIGVSIGGTCFGETGCYNGKSGHLFLVSEENQDLNVPLLRKYWDVVFTPHAYFLIKGFSPDHLSEELEFLSDLYIKNLGFMDGYHYKGPQKGTKVPAFLALDQTMIAMSLERILSPDRKSTLGALLWERKDIRLILEQYYRQVDLKLP